MGDSDTSFDAKLATRQGAQLAKMVRWYTPSEVLKMATADNAELLAMAGPRNPYPGKLGVVEEGALADLLLVDGDPVANIKLIEDPAKNFLGDHEGSEKFTKKYRQWRDFSLREPSRQTNGKRFMLTLHNRVEA